MSFDIPPMNIPDDSAEAHVLETVIGREHIAAEEVVRRALRWPCGGVLPRDPDSTVWIPESSGEGC